jgi:lipoic acid synthetase
MGIVLASQPKKRINVRDIWAFKKKFNPKNLNTICQSAKCPNIAECFKRGIVTFLILGKYCSRQCRFCAIDKRNPEFVDRDEPFKIAKAIKKLALEYVVITSVTRDDLADGGANHFAETIIEIRTLSPKIKIEVLVPDFLGNTESINVVLRANPDVFSHNLETTSNLYDKIKKGANYKRSLEVLRYAKLANFKVKTGIMLGLGETKSEIFKTIIDIKDININALTIGQYLAPTKKHYPVIKEYTMEEFETIKTFAKLIGIQQVTSGRYVRSSCLPGEN